MFKCQKYEEKAITFSVLAKPLKIYFGKEPIFSENTHFQPAILYSNMNYSKVCPKGQWSGAAFSLPTLLFFMWQ